MREVYSLPWAPIRDRIPEGVSSWLAPPSRSTLLPLLTQSSSLYSSFFFFLIFFI